VIDFLDVLQKEVWKKRIAIGFNFLLFFLLIAVLLFSGGDKKTLRDKVWEYVMCRMNYTPDDVERAYFECPYTTRMFGYEIMVRGEIEEIKKNKLFSWFYADKNSIRRLENGKIVVRGKRITGEMIGGEIKNVRVYLATVEIGVNKGLFVVSVR